MCCLYEPSSIANVACYLLYIIIIYTLKLRVPIYIYIHWYISIPILTISPSSTHRFIRYIKGIALNSINTFTIGTETLSAV